MVASIVFVMAFAPIVVADCVPVTTPAKLPVKLAADPDTFPVTLPVTFPINVAVIVPATKLPDASRATIALAVFTAVAVVAVLSTLPAAVIVASIVFVMAFAPIVVADCVPVTTPAKLPVKLAAEPDTFPVTLPINAAVIVPAAKLPDASRATIVDGEFVDVAVVAALSTLPGVFMVASIVFVMAFAPIVVADCVPVTTPAKLPVKLAADPDTFPVTLPVKLDTMAAELDDVSVPVDVIVQ
jgi:hypothetical protein